MMTLCAYDGRGHPTRLSLLLVSRVGEAFGSFASSVHRADRLPTHPSVLGEIFRGRLLGVGGRRGGAAGAVDSESMR